MLTDFQQWCQDFLMRVRTVFSTNGAGTTGDHTQKSEIWPDFTPHRKINSIWIEELNVRA